MQQDDGVKLIIFVFKKKLLTTTEVYVRQKLRQAEM